MVEGLLDCDLFKLRFRRVEKWPAAGGKPYALDFIEPSAAHALMNGVVLTVDGKERLVLPACFSCDQLACSNQTFFICKPNSFACADSFVSSFETRYADNRADHKINLLVRGDTNRASLAVHNFNLAEPFRLEPLADFLRILL